MPVTVEDFLADFSRSTAAGLASVFVGAGLSRDCGLPDWDGLLKPLRLSADVPDQISDATVTAEYISHVLGEQKLFDHVLDQTYSYADPSPVHTLLTELGIRHVWTTNYDQFLESAFGEDGFVIINDDDFSRLRDARGKTVIVKLHGSVGMDHNKLRAWTRKPIITRSHFEKFAVERPLLWNDVTANFLTTSFLFLGFSFDDPNVEVLLRLARSMGSSIQRLNHYTLMKQPTEKTERRLAELRWQDLESAGIRVVAIGEYDEIAEILIDLKRRLQPAGLFVGGSNLPPEVEQLFELTGKLLSSKNAKWHLNSLSSPAARAFGRGMAVGLKGAGRYDPERLRFHFRANTRPAGISERMGTVIYHEEEDKDLVRRRVLQDSRVVLGAGGEEGTASELDLARQAGLQVVALPVGKASSSFLQHHGAPSNASKAELSAIVDQTRYDLESAASRLAKLLWELLAIR